MRAGTDGQALYTVPIEVAAAAGAPQHVRTNLKVSRLASYANKNNYKISIFNGKPGFKGKTFYGEK
jgi:hypothetical protein